MKSYFDELDAIIKKESDILFGKSILSDLCLDRDALISLVSEYFEWMARETFLSSKGLSNNTLLLRGVSGNQKNGIYIPVISFHSEEVTNSIVTQSVFSILTPINTELLIDCYRLPAGWNCENFHPEAKIELDSTITLRPGEVLGVTPGELIYHFRFREPTLILKLQAKKISLPIEWSFDIHNKTAWQSISSHPKDSYAQHLCLAAKKLQDERLAEPLSKLLNHDRHFIRWAAAQALGGLGREMGISALTQLTADRHPNVAYAARNALQQIKDR